MSPALFAVIAIIGWVWWYEERRRRRYWQHSSGEWELLCGKYEAMAKETLADLRDLNCIENQSVPE